MEPFPSLQNLLDSLDFGVSIFDGKGTFLFVNRYVLSTSGRQRSDFLGKTVTDFFNAGILDKPIATRVIQTKQPTTGIQRSHTKTGVVKEYLVRAAPLLDADGNVAFVVADRVELWKINRQYDEATQLGDPVVQACSVLADYEEHGIVCHSKAMRRILSMAKSVSGIESSVLLQGESGTGKDVLANYIHETSGRCGSLVEINCASMPESLLESELFGYEKGAFTGALTTGKVGLIESANGGTLFLDEINSMPLSLQAKLLRVLETKTITRIGSVKSRAVNFRLVSATNADLLESVRNHAFREDLYYRLNVIPITIPPLRARCEDIIPIADHFLEHFCKKYGLEKHLSKKIYRMMECYNWPGNVRELRNFIERMVVMSLNDATVINDIPPGTLQSEPLRPTLGTEAPAEESERAHIVRALALCGGHRERTAAYLGISRRTLQYRLKQHGLLH